MTQNKQFDPAKVVRFSFNAGFGASPRPNGALVKSKDFDACADALHEAREQLASAKREGMKAALEAVRGQRLSDHPAALKRLATGNVSPSDTEAVFSGAIDDAEAAIQRLIDKEEGQ